MLASLCDVWQFQKWLVIIPSTVAIMVPLVVTIHVCPLFLKRARMHQLLITVVASPSSLDHPPSSLALPPVPFLRWHFSFLLQKWLFLSDLHGKPAAALSFS